MNLNGEVRFIYLMRKKTQIDLLLILFDLLHRETAPAGHLRWRDEQALLKAALNGDVLTDGLSAAVEFV